MSEGLAMTDLKVNRAGFPVIRGVTISAPPGQVTVLLGPNGAGKTTLLESISGLIPTGGGELSFDGTSIVKASRVRRARLGISHVEQGRSIFAELTVVENVDVSAPNTAAREEALALFPELTPRRNVLAGGLSGGEQQMLVLARALAAGPKTLLIDEMSLGLAPTIVQRLMPLCRTLADRGVGVLLVEQYADLALRIGDSAYLLNRGLVVMQGACSELLAQSDEVRRSYLGAGQSA